MNLKLASLLLIALTAGFAASACGSDDSTSSTSAAAEGTTSGSADQSGSAAVDLSTKPEVSLPTGKLPKELVVNDIVEGDGAVAEPGSLVAVQYVGVDAETGKEFDASWDRGQPFSFQLGAGMVIKGWDQGVEGMRVGGRRELIIPPDLAYGKQGSPPAIGPNATLVFVVDLQSAG